MLVEHSSHTRPVSSFFSAFLNLHSFFVLVTSFQAISIALNFIDYQGLKGTATSRLRHSKNSIKFLSIYLVLLTTRLDPCRTSHTRKDWWKIYIFTPVRRSWIEMKCTCNWLASYLCRIWDANYDGNRVPRRTVKILIIITGLWLALTFCEWSQKTNARCFAIRANSHEGSRKIILLSWMSFSCQSNSFQ